MGRALEMSVPSTIPGQPPQKHDFAFDRVFAPTVSQVCFLRLAVESFANPARILIRSVWLACW